MKKLIYSIIFVLLTFIITTVIVSIIILNGNKILKKFSIISVENISTNYIVKFEKVKAAQNYEIIIYNPDNSIFYNKKSYGETVNLNLNNIKYDQKYKMVIYAYDKVGDSISVNNPYTFKYTEPTFSNQNELIMTNDQDYILKINGELQNKEYYIEIADNNSILNKEKLITNEYLILKKYFQDLERKLEVKIYDGKEVINKIILYNKISPVSDLKLLTPISGIVLDYNDVSLTYEGGENATNYRLQIIQDNRLLTEKQISKNRCVISSDFFKKAQKYTLKVIADYKDYTDYSKSASVEFAMNEKDTLMPSYITTYYKYVKKGSNIEILNPNQSGKIYYTLNGSDPVTDGVLYDKPILVNENMVIKTVIKEDKKNNSIISTYNINIDTKPRYVVYLSPSNQDGNLGVKSVGYTNEKKEMNDLSNYIEKRLKDNGVKVIRNNPNGNINLWTSESKYYGADLHLAVHSNGSRDHNVFGIETWIDEQGSQTFSLANLIQNALMAIYPNESIEGNRGVKYANGALGEVNGLVVPFGILVEVAHHDFESDALWIMKNKELIGNTIADTVLKYFGII